MSVLSPTTGPTTTTTTTAGRPLVRTTVAAGAAAAAVTTGVAAVLHAAGVSFAIDGEMIPLAGFAQLTFIGAVIGGVLLAVLNRRSECARRRFVQATATLTALSCLPSVALPPEAATRASLVALHLIAAAMIVPVLARHAND